MGGLAALGALVVGCGVESAEAGSLSDAETESLLFMREEEKLARDVYAALGSFGDPFGNVEDSEQQHMDAILALLETYGLDDPTEGKPPGEFENQDLQALHDDLVAQGSVGLVAALQVGCVIEELDIRDIEAAKADVEHADIVETYDQLLRGSRNHLRAFYGRLVQEGGAYVPQYVDQETFDAIVTSDQEPGGRGRR